MAYYAVIDTNVLVSSMLRWESVPGSIIELAFHREIIPLLNPEILTEYESVLHRPKFHLPEDIVHSIIDEITTCGIHVEAPPLDLDLPDPKDLVFYEVTMEARKTTDARLVTGNTRHFPAQPYVMTPREMLDFIIKRSSDSDDGHE